MLKHGQFAYGNATVRTPPITLNSFVSDAVKSCFKAIVSQSPQSGGHQERHDPNGSLALGTKFKGCRPTKLFWRGSLPTVTSKEYKYTYDKSTARIA